MKIYKVAQSKMNLKTNPEAVKQAYKILEHQDIEEAHGWSQWLYFLEREKEDMADWQKEDMMDNYATSIYGQGGWNRYHVESDGTVVFSLSHSDRDSAKQAEQMGFEVV